MSIRRHRLSLYLGRLLADADLSAYSRPNRLSTITWSYSRPYSWSRVSAILSVVCLSRTLGRASRLYSPLCVSAAFSAVRLGRAPGHASRPYSFQPLQFRRYFSATSVWQILFFRSCSALVRHVRITCITIHSMLSPHTFIGKATTTLNSNNKILGA